MTTDLMGRVFGKLTVVGPASNTPPLPQVTGGWWTAECVCGRQVTAPAEGYLTGRITGCGRPGPEQRAQLEETIAAYSPPPRL